MQSKHNQKSCCTFVTDWLRAVLCKARENEIQQQSWDFQLRTVCSVQSVLLGQMAHKQTERKQRQRTSLAGCHANQKNDGARQCMIIVQKRRQERTLCTECTENIHDRANYFLAAAAAASSAIWQSSLFPSSSFASACAHHCWQLVISIISLMGHKLFRCLLAPRRFGSLRGGSFCTAVELFKFTDSSFIFSVRFLLSPYFFVQLPHLHQIKLLQNFLWLQLLILQQMADGNLTDWTEQKGTEGKERKRMRVFANTHSLSFSSLLLLPPRVKQTQHNTTHRRQQRKQKKESKIRNRQKTWTNTGGEKE